MEFVQCRDILLRESELVRQIAGLLDLIRKAVINRDWNGVEDHFKALGVLGGEFAGLESARKRIFDEIQGESDDSARFYALAVQLPDAERIELTAIFRSLKLETLRIRAAGESLMSYIAEARATIAGFFAIAFPDRGGKIYTPHGVPVSHDMRSMVLNRSF